MNVRAIVSAILVAGYMTLIFYLSSLPGHTPPLGAPLLDIPRTFLHVAEYAGLGFLAALFTVQVLSTSMWKVLVYSSLTSMVYAVTDELHQAFVPTRVCDLTDLCADVVGSVMGAAFLVTLVLVMKHETQRKNVRVVCLA